MIENVGLVRAIPVLEQFQRHGWEAVFVGGCVRDYLLGRPLKDIDIATSATPEQVMAIFPKTIPTGLKHGTVTVVWDDETYEVTTYRKESAYEGHRRPAGVEFVTELEGDLLRRDFTINALAMRADGSIVDPFGGMRDLRMRVLRCVGDPEARFQEDALRMMRAVRFAGDLGLRIAPGTWRALKRHRSLLKHIAMERIGAEADKIMSGGSPHKAAAWFAASGLVRHTKAPLPDPVAAAAGNYAQRQKNGGGSGFDNDTDTVRRQIAALSALESAEERWAALAAALQLAPEDAGELFAALRYSSARVAMLAAFSRLNAAMNEALVRYRGDAGKGLPNAEERLRRSWLGEVLREGGVTAMLWLRVSDRLACAAPEEQAGQPLLGMLAGWLEATPIRSLRQLAVSGAEVASALREQPGPWLGQLLAELLRAAAFGDVPNERKLLLELAVQLRPGNANLSGNVHQSGKETS